MKRRRYKASLMDFFTQPNPLVVQNDLLAHLASSSPALYRPVFISSSILLVQFIDCGSVSQLENASFNMLKFSRHTPSPAQP